LIMAEQKPQGVGKIVSWADDFQRRHSFVGFPYAVIKKYGDDEAANRGALITYYGFLSLFPLLLVLTSVLQLLFRSESHFREQVISKLVKYFPVVGSQLESNIHTFHRAGLALIIGILITLYGARGGAMAFRNTLNHIWQIPRPQRGGFPLNIVKSLAIIFIAGAGLILATVLSSFATSLGHSLLFSAFAVLISTFILLWMFMLIFNLSISTSRISYSDFLYGSITAAVGIQILQVLGGFIITHQLKNLTSLYGTFALVLGILFWIYLQVQIVLYAAEVDTVRVLKLWPRSLVAEQLTTADKKAYSLYAKKERYQPEPPEEIEVRFEQK
jgi:membrane protein